MRQRSDVLALRAQHPEAAGKVPLPNRSAHRHPSGLIKTLCGPRACPPSTDASTLRTSRRCRVRAGPV